MGEDVSSQIRVGITVILVAALIVAVLNLMVVAQNVMSSGLGTLESGVDQISAQEFEKYNQKKLSGTSVKAAISLYQSKDMCIVVRTKACIEGKSDGAYAYMYGSLAQSTNGDKPTSRKDVDGNMYYYCATENIIKQKSGEAFYTGEYWVVNGVIQLCNNTTGVVRSGDPQTILEQARFRAFLIKNAAGAPIGIYFEQIT